MVVPSACLTRTQICRNHQNVIRRFAHLFVIIALVAGIGGHWAILQSIAWTTMLANNLQRTSLVEAVSDTFDGEHPCPMCKAIEKSRADEKNPQDKQQGKSGSKFEPGLAWQTDIYTLSRAREWVASSDESLTITREGPPKPRPRPTVPTIIS